MAAWLNDLRSAQNSAAWSRFKQLVSYGFEHLDPDVMLRWFLCCVVCQPDGKMNVTLLSTIFLNKRSTLIQYDLCLWRKRFPALFDCCCLLRTKLKSQQAKVVRVSLESPSKTSCEPVDPTWSLLPWSSQKKQPRIAMHLIKPIIV